MENAQQRSESFERQMDTVENSGAGQLDTEFLRGTTSRLRDVNVLKIFALTKVLLLVQGKLTTKSFGVSWNRQTYSWKSWMQEIHLVRCNALRKILLL